MNSKIFPILKSLLQLVKESFDASTTTEDQLKTKICSLLSSPRLQQENCTQTHHVVSGVTDIFREIIPLNTALLTLLPLEDTNASNIARTLLNSLAKEIKKENIDELREINQMRDIWTNIHQNEYFKLGLTEFLDTQSTINTAKLRATLEIISKDTHMNIKEFNKDQAKVHLMSLDSPGDVNNERIL